MMDDADRADVLNELHLSAKIQRVRARDGGHAFQAEPGPRLCMECGEEIPQDRILAVPECRLCIECQTEAEGRWT